MALRLFISSAGVAGYGGAQEVRASIFIASLPRYPHALLLVCEHNSANRFTISVGCLEGSRWLAFGPGNKSMRNRY